MKIQIYTLAFSILTKPYYYFIHFGEKWKIDWHFRCFYNAELIKARSLSLGLGSKLDFKEHTKCHLVSSPNTASSKSLSIPMKGAEHDKTSDYQRNKAISELGRILTHEHTRIVQNQASPHATKTKLLPCPNRYWSQTPRVCPDGKMGQSPPHRALTVQLVLPPSLFPILTLLSS